MKDTKLQRKLRAARLNQGLSLRDVSARSHYQITNSYVSELESGSRRTPSPKHLRALASALKLDFLELMILADYLTIKDLKGKL